MGSEFFSESAKGKTAREAFKKAVEDAQYDCGHGGYTGTIAEKHSFVMMGECQTLNEAFNLAESLEGDERVDDKWGPAGCIKVLEKEGLWVFFGWASS